MPPIVLVHGSWHWAGCFTRVQEQLRLRGQTSLAVDNASHGQSPVSWSDIATMEDYARPVAELVEAQSEAVILVGHSMGGVTLSYLAEIMPERIAALVYLSGFMTGDGLSAMDQIGKYHAHEACAPLFEATTLLPDSRGIKLHVERQQSIREAFYADCTDEDIAFATRHVCEINTIVPNLYTPRITHELERHYITCSQDRAIPLASQEDMITRFPNTVTHRLDTSHSPYFSAAAPLAEILSAIALRPRG